MRSILIRRALRSHGRQRRRFKRAGHCGLACMTEAGGGTSADVPVHCRLMHRCLAAAALQLPTALDFTVHRRQFSDGLVANFVGFSFNTQTCRSGSSALHVAAAAAHLFPL